MFLDLHCHSVSSDDSRATVEQYVKWVQVLRKRGHTVDGIVLTEHRKFDFDKDYSSLAEQYAVLVLKGSELDTRFGHFLVYGVSDALRRDIDFSDVRLDSRDLMAAARQHDALGSTGSSGAVWYRAGGFISGQGERFDGLEIVELVNGGSRSGENERAEHLCRDHGYLGIGGSDAHLTSHIAACMTEFASTIATESDLVEALLSKEFRPVWLQEATTGSK